MDTTQEKPIQPFQPYPNLNFGITPFGIYCFECNLPIGNIGSSGIIGTFRKHINRKKHHISSDQCISDLVSSLENAIKYRYGNIRNYDKWFEMKNTAVWRCSCGLITKSHFNLTRHIESRQEDGHIGKKGLGHFTTCKRTIENNTILEMMNKPVNIVSVDTTSTSSVTLSTITSSSDRNIPLHNYCVPVKSTNNKWLTTTLEDVRKVFDKYKRLDEVLDPYLPLLKLLIIWCEGNVIKQIEWDLALMENNNGVVAIHVENNKDFYTILKPKSRLFRRRRTSKNSDFACEEFHFLENALIEVGSRKKRARKRPGDAILGSKMVPKSEKWGPKGRSQKP